MEKPPCSPAAGANGAAIQRGRWRKQHPPEPLRAFPPLSQRCALRAGGRPQRGGAALARGPLAWAAPEACATRCAGRYAHSTPVRQIPTRHTR
ncbi:MAG: hypothetical protein C0492_15865 [Verminephrobacter sp.]|nr:hypothetical protein [Verminephrobacter sp.]